MSRSRLAAVFVLLIATTAYADNTTWPVERGPSHEPVAVRFDRKMVTEAPKEFLDDSAACILYCGNTYVIEDDGTVEETTHDLTRLNGRKGVEKLGEYRNIVYDPSFQKLTLHQACIHKPDGRVVEVEPRHVQLRDVSTDYQVYDREKQLIISFPTLEVGDVIDVKWTVRGKNPEYGGQFFTRYTFGDATYPTLVDEIRVRVHHSKTLKYAVVNAKLDPVIERGNEHDTYHWRMTRCSRLPQDENLPSREEMVPAVSYSTFATWEEVGAWKQRLRAEAWRVTPEVTRVVNEVTAGLTDPTAKATALTYWLRRNIRYVSSGEKHDYTPHAPAMVIANRFGDCKDTSQLLAVMLRAAGINVELVTLGALDDGQVLENVPSPWGTHAILHAAIDGKEHWIDTTASLAGWDYLPRDDRNRVCYLVDANGKIRLGRTPPMTHADNRMEQTTTMWIGTNGSSRCERTVVAYGSAAMGLRDTLLEVPSGERRRQIAAELQDANSHSRLSHLRVDEKTLRELGKPVTTHLTFEIGSQFTGTPDREGSISDNKVWAKFLAYNLDYDRQVPVEFVAPFESVHRYIVHLPAAYVLDDMPKGHAIRSKWGSFTVKVKPAAETARVVEFEFTMRLEKPRVAVADFDAFRQFHEDVGRNYRVWLTLKPATSLKDAPLMEAVLAMTPEDIGNAAILAKLYKVNDKNEAAARVLHRALHYRPDEVELRKLAVRVAKGPEDEEIAQRELVRRAPEEPGYVIDLGAILVNRGKQEEARKLLKPLTERGGAANRARAHYQLARSYYRRDELKDALVHLDAAETADADTANTMRSFILRGEVLEEMGKPQEAIRAYLRALAIDHEALQPLDSLVRLSLATGKTNDALDYLRRYVVAVGDEPSGMVLAAETYSKLGHDAEALDLAGRALASRYAGKAERVIGLISLNRGDPQQAAAHLAKAEGGSTVYEALVRARIGLGELDQAAALLEPIAKIAKPSEAVRASAVLVQRLVKRRDELLAGVVEDQKKAARPALDCLVCAEYASTKMLEERLTKLAKELKLGPLAAWSARHALEHGKLSLALADAEKAITLSPLLADGYFIRGRVKLERNTAGAVDDLFRAVELSQRKDADMLRTWGEALHQHGAVREAVEALRLAVKLRPKDAGLADQLAGFEREIGGSK